MYQFILTILLLYLNFVTAIAQGNFENGYFIDNYGEKTTCLIKNEGWNDNPRSFKYLKNMEGETLIKNIADVKGFGVGINIRFIRAEVKIDKLPE